MKIDISVRFGKALLRVVSLGVALFSGVVTFFLTGPTISESKELRVTNKPVVIVAQQKPQIQTVKAIKKQISPIRKLVYTEYQRKLGNGQKLLSRINKYGPIIESAARHYNLDPDLIVGLIAYESGGKNWAVSGANARGLMQIGDVPKLCIRQVKKIFKVAQLDLHNPNHNIYLGTATLAQYIEMKGEPLLALVAYNVGPGLIKSKNYLAFTKNSNSEDLKRFPMIVSAYALMSKVQRQTGHILPLNDKTQGIFNGIELPGVI